MKHTRKTKAAAVERVSEAEQDFLNHLLVDDVLTLVGPEMEARLRRLMRLEGLSLPELVQEALVLFHNENYACKVPPPQVLTEQPLVRHNSWARYADRQSVSGGLGRVSRNS